jgi:EpsI family protein
VVGLVAVSMSLGVQASVTKVQHQSLKPIGDLSAPVGTGGWVPLARSDWPWNPALLGTDYVISQTYRKGAFEVHLDIALYPSQEQHSEAINSQNVLVKQKDPDWRIVGVEKFPLELPKMSSTVNSYVMTSVAGGVLGSEGRRLLAWQWYRLGSHATADPITGKLLAAANLIYPGRRDGAFVVITTDVKDDEEESRKALSAFVKEMGEAVNRSLDIAVLGPAIF